MQSAQDPGLVLDHSDPGDSVQQKFRYQNTYAAIASCALMLDYGVTAVFCEHHEDVLVKFTDGSYQGIQVKTRESHLAGFNFNDPAIIKSITRFVNLELKYPGKFKTFKIVSNSGFAKTKKNNLVEFVAMAKDGKVSELTTKNTKSNKFINDTCKKLKCEASTVIDVLGRIDLRPDFANLADIKKSLVYEIKSLPGMGEQTLGKLEDIADKLIFRAYNASSKGDEEIMEAFLIGKSFEEAQKVAVLGAKTIDRKQVEEIFNTELTSPIVHFLKDSTSLFGKESGNKVLEKKLDAGGINSNNVSLLKDQKFSFDTYVTKLVHKLGVEITRSQYDQIQLIVQTVCQEVYDQFHTEEELYGMKMLTEIRTRLMTRLQIDTESFNEFKYEHLLGMVAVLTEDCKVWWSPHFYIELQ